MTDFILVETTTDSRELADRIAKELVDTRSGACVHIGGPIESVYRWKDEVQRDKEFTLSIKTRRDLYDTVEKLIRELHSYDEPQIIATELVAGSKGYLEWIASETIDES